MTDQPEGISSDDRMWAAIGYIPMIGPLIAILMLLMEDRRARPFIKFHAVQSIALVVILGVVFTILSVVSFGILAFCAWAIFLIPIWPAYDSFQGNYTELPILTNFLKNQGWA